MAAPAVLVAVLVALALGAAPAAADTTLGTLDPAGPPQGYVSCSGCSAGGAGGLRQLALQGATLEAPEPGVLVSARVYARRNGGSEPPRIAVVRPTEGIAAEIVDSAPLPVSAPGGRLEEVRDLHLPVEPGDSIAFLVRGGEVAVGTRTRPQPDGALVTFALPCAPCGVGGTTGVELLLEGTVEPDEDGDLLGDETQDPDGGGLFEEEEEEPFDEEELEELESEDDSPAARSGRLRLLRFVAERDGGATLILAAPRRGRLAGVATTGRGRRVAAGRARVPSPGRVRLELNPLREARPLLARPGPLPARVLVRFRPRAGKRQTLALRISLSRRAARR